LEAGPLAEANEWLERYRQIWEESFERLDDLLKKLTTQNPRHLKTRHTAERKRVLR
jgi:hypothetical protein